MVDSYPYQSGARVLLGMDAPEAIIRDHAKRVEDAIAPLDPVLIYFDRGDAVQSTRAIAAQRGPQWTAFLVELITRSPYVQRRGLAGMDAVDTMIGEYKALVDSMVTESRLPRLVLRDYVSDWDACSRRIDDFLGLP